MPKVGNIYGDGSLTQFFHHPNRNSAKLSNAEVDDILERAERTQVIVQCRTAKQALAFRQICYRRRRAGAPSAQMIEVLRNKVVLHPRGELSPDFEVELT